MGKYEEDVYDRAEKKFKTVDKQIEWLLSFGGQHGGSGYELDALVVGGDLQKSKNLSDEIKKINHLQELDVYDDEISKVYWGKEYPKKELKDRKEFLKNKLKEREQDIQVSLTSAKDLKELDNVKKRIKRLQEEEGIDTSDLEEVAAGLKESLGTQRKEERRRSIEQDIEKATSLDDVDNVKKRIDNLEGEIDKEDVEELRNVLGGKK